MNKLLVSAPPHIFSKNTTTTVMLDVCIALIPAFATSILFFGISSLFITIACVVSAVLFEYLTQKLMKREPTINDFSAIVTGLLLAFSLPPSTPIWVCVIGSFFAIVIVKQIFGGIGNNFANPAATARIFLLVSFPTFMATWTEPFAYKYGVDTIASATPLNDINAANTLDLFLGNVSGSIGEVSAIALLIGGVYLVLRRVINPLVPITYLASIFIFTLLFGDNPVNHIFAGSVMIAAIFMITDYSSTPTTLRGRIIFAVGCALITALIRVFGSYPEGVSFAILFMNLITPLLNRATRIRPLGTQEVK